MNGIPIIDTDCDRTGPDEVTLTVHLQDGSVSPMTYSMSLGEAQDLHHWLTKALGYGEPKSYPPRQEVEV